MNKCVCIYVCVLCYLVLRSFVALAFLSFSLIRASSIKLEIHVHVHTFHGYHKSIGKLTLHLSVSPQQFFLCQYWPGWRQTAGNDRYSHYIPIAADFHLNIAYMYMYM